MFRCLQYAVLLLKLGLNSATIMLCNTMEKLLDKEIIPRDFHWTYFNQYAAINCLKQLIYALLKYYLCILVWLVAGQIPFHTLHRNRYTRVVKEVLEVSRLNTN